MDRNREQRMCDFVSKCLDVLDDAGYPHKVKAAVGLELIRMGNALWEPPKKSMSELVYTAHRSCGIDDATAGVIRDIARKLFDEYEVN